MNLEGDPTTVSLLRMFKGESFKNRVVVCGGRTTGFDYLRISLAMLVILVHTPLTTNAGASWIWEGYARPFVASILPAFFALSGFLVVGSLQRSKTLTEFALLRALRLVPALFVEVIVAALILGPMMTEFSLPQYFSDVKLYYYSLNIVGEIQYQLPGLFIHNPDPNTVNRQLWTIPSELRCYASLMLLSVLRVATRWKWMVGILLICMIAFPTIDALRHKNIWEMDNVPSLALVLAFLTGVTANLLMKWIPMNWTLFTFSVMVAYFAMLFRESSYFACIPITYVTIFIGLSQPPKIFITATGDYSYGVYLYGYPIQQSYAYLFPHFRVWWGSLLFSVPIVVTLAFLSWELVESNVLKHRAKIIKIAVKISSGVLQRRWEESPSK